MDFRYAFRQLRRNPGFSILAILILALGIGANTALFSVINGVLLRPLAYKDPERIVALWTRWMNNPNAGLGWVSGPDFADWRDRSSVFEALAAYNGGEASAVAGGVAHYAEIRSVTRGFDRVFGIPPAQGRWFTPDEETPTIVVSHAFAQRAFQGDAIGKSLKISERSSTIVGVMPPGFRFPDKTDIWTFAGTELEKAHRTGHNWQVVARIKEGETLEQARAQMDAIGEQLAQQYPKENGSKRIAVTPLKERLVRDVRTTLLMLFGAVALVLLIACANISNLLLAKASARSKELAVRAALGAGRTRIVRQLLTESLLLGLLGGAAGVAIGYFVLKMVAVLAPANLPRITEVQVDPTVLTFTAAISVGATLLFGLLPALKISRVDVNESLKKSGGRGATTARLPQALVVGEIALATMLAIGAGLLIRSFSNLLDTDLGYHTQKVLVTEARVMFSREPEGALRNVRLYQEMLGEIRQLPGVEAAAGIQGMPGVPLHSNGSYEIGGAGSSRPGNQSALFTVVTPDYFSTMGIRLEGRDFTVRDVYDVPFVAIVNRALARHAFPNGDAIGQQIRCGLDSPNWMTIVGVVEDSRTMGPAARHQAEIYMPAMQHPRPAQWMNLVTRAAIEPSGLHEPIRQVVTRRNPEVPVKFTTIESVMAENVASPRFRTVLLGTMASLAVVLAMAGVYGVMAYGVGRRTAEFGVRMALGASPGDIVRVVLSRGGALTAVGLAIGIAGALAAARLLETMVFGVTARDAVTYAGVAVLIAGVALAANLVPALRAGRVDPMTALREE